MTLTEVIATGRRFRRAGETVWCFVATGVVVYDSDKRGTKPHRIIGVADVTADDWHDEEPEVLVTRRKLLAAAERAAVNTSPDVIALEDVKEFAMAIADALGAK